MVWLDSWSLNTRVWAGWLFQFDISVGWDLEPEEVSKYSLNWEAWWSSVQVCRVLVLITFYKLRWVINTDKKRLWIASTSMLRIISASFPPPLASPHPVPLSLTQVELQGWMAYVWISNYIFLDKESSYPLQIKGYVINWRGAVCSQEFCATTSTRETRTLRDALSNGKKNSRFLDLGNKLETNEGDQSLRSKFSHIFIIREVARLESNQPQLAYLSWFSSKKVRLNATICLNAWSKTNCLENQMFLLGGGGLLFV